MSFPFNPSVFKYKVEVSMDAKNYTTVLDRTDNTVSRNTIFDEFAPIECRFVRLTITEWPANTALSVLDFSVFGKATGYSPSEVAVPPLKDMSKK